MEIVGIVVVLAGVIAMLADMSFRASFFSRHSGDDNRAGNVMMLIGLAVALLAPIASTLIHLAVSRKREYLADASGALLTRYPTGLANALAKIKADPNPLKTAHTATAHLFLSSPFKGKETTSWLTKLFMTHPPLEDRIRILKDMNL